MARAAGKSLVLITALVIQYLCLMPVQCYVVREESSYRLGKLKTTRLRFFLQDFISTRNATAFKVAQANISSPVLFGDTYVIDDPMTDGVSPSSKVLGTAQGIYALTGSDRFSFFMAVDFGFTTGKYNGSSISMVSRNPVWQGRREMAVVSGRGQFRLARGFAYLTTRYFVGLDATVQYDVTVLHY